MKDVRRKFTRTVPGVLFLIAGSAYCQPADSRPAFDAVSMKLSTEDPKSPLTMFRMRGGPGTGSPGRITYTQVTLGQLLTKAWNVQEYQIVGPAWRNLNRGRPLYTIMATMRPETTPEEFRLMLQDLIVKRLRMELHHETRRVAGFELCVAKSGPKLKEAVDTSESDDFPSNGIDKQGFPLLPTGHKAGRALVNGGLHAKFQSWTMSELATELMGFIPQAHGEDPMPIIDETGLSGKYDFTLLFDYQGRAIAPRATRAAPPPAGGGGEIAPAESTTESGSFPDILTALEQQLGLKLVRAKEVPLAVLVIDRVNMVPTEN